MRPAIILRRVRPSQIAVVHRLLRAGILRSPYRKSVRRVALDRFSLSNLRQMARDSKRSLLVATQDTKPIGVIVGWNEPGSFWVEWIVVAGRWLRHGIASEMFRQLEDLVRRLGFSEIGCDVSRKNIAALRLVQQFDYRPVTEDYVYMRKKLR